jgi:DNA helicase-2/ATP-dependent DNA helicase PcrA
MAIACAHCRGEHETPTEVRACWAGGDPATDRLPIEVDTGADDALPPGTSLAGADAAPVPITPSPVAAGSIRQRVPAGAGPDELGRNAIVAPGDIAPEPWASSERLHITAEDLAEPGSAVARLRTAAHERRRVVIELAVEQAAAREPMLMTDSAPFVVGPRFTFDGEELHHLIWSNSVDLRGDEPSWTTLDAAIDRGLDTASGPGVGDVVLPSGETVWIDGGPFRRTDPIDGVPVVPAVSIEHGGGIPPGAGQPDVELAADQLAAVTHEGGAARIIAPAGSGKTRVLTERARHLLREWNVPPGAVTLLAFNKRAQLEMTERTPDLPGLQIRTLNSLALAIVNGSRPFAPQPRRWTTIDEPDVRRIIGDLVSFPRRRNSDPVAPWIEALSLIRLGLVDPDEAEQRYDGDVEGLAAFWPSYRELLDRRGVVDFDDQIHRALLVLLADPAARRVAQRVCRVMLVDEFQDLTPAHLLLIRLLASPGGAVFGVGDDDQTIYGYNGADPAWLIDFDELFPGSGDHPLEVNYRCPAGVVESADRLLRHNRRRVAKTIRAASSDPGGWAVDDSVDPVAATVGAVRAARDAGVPTDEIAVLTRVNAVLAPVQVALVGDGIPIAGGVGLEFLDRTSVRSVLAWLRLAGGGEGGRLGEEDLREALRRPSRSFHPRIADWICEQRSVVDLFKLASRLNKERDSERLIEFAADVQRLQKAVSAGAPTSDLVFTLIDDIGLGGTVANLDTTRRGMNRAAQGDDLTAVQHLAALHDDIATFEAWLRSRLAATRSADGVVLATVHRVKGQEWPHVVAHLVDRDQYPHRLADDVEEERRLFHVALTRARVHATVVTGPNASPFVEELTSEPSPDRVVRSHRVEPHSAGAGRKSDPAGDLDGPAIERFERLKALRLRLAEGKPAYVVFDNKTLAAIARTAPTTRQELSRISGVGPAKLDRYGDAVIELITTAD